MSEFEADRAGIQCVRRPEQKKSEISGAAAAGGMYL